MRQLEGSFYDTSKIQLSRRRIDRTGYFSDVNVETQPVPSNPDQVDITYTVREKPTGAIMLGVGVSSVEKFAVSTSVQQSNAFGTGKFLSANVNSGSVNKVYSLSYLDPFWTVDGVRQGFDVYKRKTDASSLSVGPYSTDSVGGGVKFGYPIAENISIDFGANVESVKLQTFTNSPFQYVDFTNQFGNNYTYASLSAGWAFDTRNSVIQPTKGSMARVAGEFSAGGLQFYKLSYQQQYFYPIGRDYTVFLHGDLGYAGGLSGKPLPFFKAYFVGGPDSVRGYRAFSLGPHDAFSNALGGDRKVSGSAEFLFPVPGATREQSLRMSAFIDGGQVFGAGQKMDFGELRYSTGIGLQWLSPFGPLRLSFAQPLNAKKDIDHVQRLQFTFGTAF
jgi:outer membrane protein insertion porin family